MRRLIQFCLDDPAFTGFAVRVLQLTWRAWHWWRAGSR
jgi:hypothetical protein